MNMTPEQAVYSAAFTQALAVACGLTCFGDDGLECYPPNEASISSAKRWAEAAVRAWHDAHTTAPSGVDRRRSGGKGCFRVGDRVRFARLEGPEVHHSDAPPLGWEGVIDEDDDSSLPFRVTGDAWASGYRSEDAWWFAPEALDRVEPTT